MQASFSDDKHSKEAQWTSVCTKLASNGVNQVLSSLSEFEVLSTQMSCIKVTIQMGKLQSSNYHTLGIKMLDQYVNHRGFIMCTAKKQTSQLQLKLTFNHEIDVGGEHFWLFQSFGAMHTCEVELDIHLRALEDEKACILL